MAGDAWGTVCLKSLAPRENGKKKVMFCFALVVSSSAKIIVQIIICSGKVKKIQEGQKGHCSYPFT